MTFASNLKRLRDANGWTQAATSRMSGIPLRTIQNWEGGSREPRLAALKQLADGLGVKADELLAGIGESEKPAPKKKARGKESRPESGRSSSSAKPRAAKRK
jgi:transcriptional regulator with XRE-family HTH domain